MLGSDPLQDKGGLVVNGLETPHTHGIGAVGTRRPKAQAVRLDELGDNRSRCANLTVIADDGLVPIDDAERVPPSGSEREPPPGWTLTSTNWLVAIKGPAETPARDSPAESPQSIDPSGWPGQCPRWDQDYSAADSD